MNELLHDHVESFNAGVRTGNWSSMLEHFADTAEMEFSGVPVGPFIGKEAIAAAYRDQPPTTSCASSRSVSARAGSRRGMRGLWSRRFRRATSY